MRAETVVETSARDVFFFTAAVLREPILYTFRRKKVTILFDFLTRTKLKPFPLLRTCLAYVISKASYSRTEQYFAAETFEQLICFILFE